MEQKTIYFEKSVSKEDTTQTTLEAARKRASELGIKQVLVASTHGYTALEALKIFKNTDIEIIAVGLSYACSEEGWVMTPAEKSKIENGGAKVFIGMHSLSRGTAEAFLGNASPANIVAQTLYCFSQGMKVAVEISIMAVEAGLVGVDREIISVAGTGEGADTAVVLTPSYGFKFQDIKIHEIISKPRIP